MLFRSSQPRTTGGRGPCRAGARRLLPGAVLLFGVGAAALANHPRLLITADDVPRRRHAAGVELGAGDSARLEIPEAWGRFGARAADYQSLRACFGTRVSTELLPGELLAAAFLHLIEPQNPQDDVRLALVNAALGQSGRTPADALEAVVALDWCWDRVEPGTRREFLLNLRQCAQPLTPADSPLDGRRFREKLAALALALAVDETDEPSPSWVTTRQHLLAAAQTYFQVTFPTYVAWRGLSPTGPAVAAREECDTVIAIELSRQVLGRDPWPPYRDTVGRWLEHYVLAALDDPRRPYHFVRDDAGDAPLLPAPPWSDLLPVTAHLLAARTGDPSAAWLADRVENAMRADAAGLSATLWRWVPLLFDAHDVPHCDTHRLPAARNLGGAVVFRGGAGPDTTAIWIEAGQPFLRRRQHFDAGHFLIRRGGELVGGGGDDILLEAVPAKGGGQYLGPLRTPFDFEQYYTAGIAHNTVVLYDAARVARWNGARYLPAGGQRCVDGTCTDFVTALDQQGRLPARQLAYGQRADAAYLALDLTPAYDSRMLSRYTRQFVFIWGRALVVADRLTVSRGRGLPTWVLNLPARPLVDGADLEPRARVAGSTNDAGVWRCDSARYLRWNEGDGALWLVTPLPSPRVLRVVGGPARRLAIARGRHASQTYVGGEPDGFERLIIPAEQRGAENGWYRLGEPTLLGASVSHTPHWGRVELEPPERTTSATFVVALITDRADATQPPSVELSTDDTGLTLTLSSGAERATLRLGNDVLAGGRLDMPGTPALSWTLPTTVEPDPPLPITVDSPSVVAGPR